MAISATTKRPPGGGPSLTDLADEAPDKPNRTVLYAVEGWGKTSLACHAPDPIGLMIDREDGLLTLLRNGRVPRTRHFREPARTWNEVLMALQELVVHRHDRKVLFVDTLNGVERLLVNHVTEKHYQGDPDKFNAFGRGWKLVPDEWAKFLDRLDRLNAAGMAILLLAHAEVDTFRNPEGTDYDRYTPRLSEHTWSPTLEWADMVLFGQLETFVRADDPKARKGKAVGGQTRLLYCERTAVADAKNRCGLPPVVNCGYGAGRAWEALAAALVAGRENAPHGGPGDEDDAPTGETK